MSNALFVCALGALTVCRVFAQEESRQATITGRPGSPKCTIEVDVDAVADIEIRGTVAHIHTLAGAPTTWRRFECNQPMPVNPAGFRFRGIDGRGRQTLIGDPMSGGVAVVRIEDPKSGREGYTFDLEWQGSMGPLGGGPVMPPPYPQGPPPGGDRDHDRDRDFHFGRDAAMHQCADAAQDKLHRDGYSDTQVIDIKMDGEGDHGDWVSGTLSGRRGPRLDNFGFACPVDFQGRRVGDVHMRPANDGYYGGDADHNHFSRERAIRACGDAVQDRLRHDGYTDFNIARLDIDDRPGNNDWIVGGLAARRGGYSDNFEFSCSVDFDAGRIRSVNVNRR